MAALKGLLLLGLCSEHQITLHDQSVKQILSGYFYRLSDHFFFLYSAGWSHAAFSAGIRIWDIFTHRHANKSENDCKCS